VGSKDAWWKTSLRRVRRRIACAVGHIPSKEIGLLERDRTMERVDMLTARLEKVNRMGIVTDCKAVMD